jgi:hypothetical protein
MISPQHYIGCFQTSMWTRLKQIVQYNKYDMKTSIFAFLNTQRIQIASFHASQEVGRK